MNDEKMARINEGGFSSRHMLETSRPRHHNRNHGTASSCEDTTVHKIRMQFASPLVLFSINHPWACVLWTYDVKNIKKWSIWACQHSFSHPARCTKERNMDMLHAII
jgi:hypothetical protein